MLRKHKRIIAIFLLLNFVTSIVQPTISWALTAGPTAPEATSFEPVDTTDMVNLLSGDFIYNIPLLEVPGPAGAYPFSLSYHAGIQPDEDASMVGLGFTLNTGAITRSVNGYADDYKDVNNFDRVYWEGGSRETYSAGVSIGLGNTPANLSFGLAVSQDTYQGVSVVGHMGMRLGPIGVSGSSDGQISASASAGNVGISLSRSGLTGTFSMRNSALGYSIDTKGNSSVTVGGVGISGVHNSQAGKIRTSNNGLNLDIPVLPGVNISLGYNYQRYWSDETAIVTTNGILYTPRGELVPDFDEAAFDYYTLHSLNANIIDWPDPDVTRGGSFPSFDDYNVAAQGLSGSMRPYVYKDLVLGQNKKTSGGMSNNSFTIGQYPHNAQDYQNKQIGFRFNNDFSNRHTYSGGTFNVLNGEPVRTVFSANEQTGPDGNDGLINDKLPGSRNIEWYTNAQIAQGNSNLLNCIASGFDRSLAPADQIGGFRITNESGVTYHFALPVYSSYEKFYSEKIDRKMGLSYNSLRKDAQYAYTWYLTAITGPDYVDNNGNNKPDKGDWGYWIEFGYSKHTDNYLWRNPSTGFHKDIDTKFQNYSAGKKELYYLDFVRSETHIAVFEKSERLDGKEVRNRVKGGHSPDVPRERMCTDEQNEQCMAICNVFNPDAEETCLDMCNNRTQCPYFNNEVPDSPLRLDKIKLYDRRDYDAGNQSISYCLRAIDFSYDYSLAPETINSFDTENPSVLHGKLTLNAVQFLGKGGASLIPPISFQYELEKNLGDGYVLYDVRDTGSFDKSVGSAMIFQIANDNSRLKRGMIISFIQDDKLKYGFLHHTYNASYGNLLIALGKTQLSGGPISQVRETRNPPYQVGAYDSWGMYMATAAFMEDESHRGTPEALNVDAWCLRKIKSSLGAVINVEYESDDYSKIVLNNSYQYAVELLYADDIAPGTNNKVHIELATRGVPVDRIFKVGGILNLLVMTDAEQQDCENIYPWVREYELPIASIDVGNDRISVNSQELRSTLVNPLCDKAGRRFLAAHVGSSDLIHRSGGGVRVKSISFENGAVKHKTVYDYVTTGGKSSGVVSFEPFSVGTPIVDLIKLRTGTTEKFTIAEKDYNRILFDSFSKIFNLSREVPAPGVMYREVTVREGIENSGQMIVQRSSKYEFETFDESMIGKVVNGSENYQFASQRYAGKEFNAIQTSDLSLKNYTSRVGNLKRVTTFDGKGNKISELVNEYLSDNINSFQTNIDTYEPLIANFENQGIIHETYADVKFVNTRLDAQITRRQQYPSILVRQKSTNFKTGVSTITENLSYDFYSSVVTKQLTRDGYGNSFITETTPAYQVYGGMGLCLNGGTNMLTQEAANYVYKVNSNLQPVGLVSALVQTWSNRVNIDNINPADYTHILRLNRTNDPSLYSLSALTNLGLENLYKAGDQLSIPFTLTIGNVTETMILTASVVSRNSPTSYTIKFQNLQPTLTSARTVSVTKLLAYKKHRSFSFIGNDAVALGEDGLYGLPNNRLPLFTAWRENENASNDWQKVSELTLYDVHSHALEAKDINGDFAATKMSFDQTKVFATVVNAQYKEFAYSGAEDALQGSNLLGGNVTYEGAITTASVHTGSQAVSSSNGQKAFLYTFDPEQRSYHISVWSNKPTAAIKYKLDGGAEQTATLGRVRNADGWYLIEATIDLTGTHQSCEVWCTPDTTGSTVFDDFRVHPVDAAMTSYVYNEWGELSHVLNANNLYTEYLYDDMGRLKETIRESFEHGRVTTSRQTYHYSGQ